MTSLTVSLWLLYFLFLFLVSSYRKKQKKLFWKKVLLTKPAMGKALATYVQRNYIHKEANFLVDSSISTQWERKTEQKSRGEFFYSNYTF